MTAPALLPADVLRPDYRSAVRRRLSQAPAGPHMLHEAALMWHFHRPANWRELGPPSRLRHLPVAYTDRPEAAARLARLLDAPGCPIVRDGFEVAVPSHDYRVVTRTLGAAWRRLRTALAADQLDLALAVAMWRMSILCFGQELGPRRITLAPADAGLCRMLVVAARSLGLHPHLQGDRTIALTGQDDVQNLIGRAGA